SSLLGRAGSVAHRDDAGVEQPSDPPAGVAGGGAVTPTAACSFCALPPPWTGGGGTPRSLRDAPYGWYCWSSERTVSMLTSIQKPVVIGSNNGRGNGFSPLTSCASCETVIGVPVTPLVRAVTWAVAGTSYV